MSARVWQVFIVVLLVGVVATMYLEAFGVPLTIAAAAACIVAAIEDENKRR